MKRLLLYLSKTDDDILRFCPKSSEYQQTSMGAFVLFTGILAFFSATYAASNLFLESAGEGQVPLLSFRGLLLSMMIGLLYAMMIMAIDREIVSATQKWAVAFRAPLALIIGVVIAVPLEVKLLEPNIIEEIRNQEYQEASARKYTILDSVVNEYTGREQVLIQKRDRLLDSAAIWLDVMQAEVAGQVMSRARKETTSIPGEGPAYRQARANKEAFEARATNVEEELKSLREEKRIITAKAEGRASDFGVRKSYDLLSKYRTLGDLQEKDAAVR